MNNASLDVELKEILRKHKPSQLDVHFTTVCPFFKHRNSSSQLYSLIHDIATSRVLEKLQLRFSDLSFANELELEFGRVDGAASRLALAKEGEYLAFIEVKTGKLKLLQPAIYTYIEGVKTIVADLKMGEIFVIDIKTAERLVKELIEHMKDRMSLKKIERRIPNKECKYCASECEFRVEESISHNPLRNLSVVLDNIDHVVEQIVEEISTEIQK
jgi:hypothetical protein